MKVNFGGTKLSYLNCNAYFLSSFHYNDAKHLFDSQAETFYLLDASIINLCFGTSSYSERRSHHLNFRFTISSYYHFKKEEFYFLTLFKLILNIYFEKNKTNKSTPNLIMIKF
jgi:hypothetical protein